MTTTLSSLTTLTLLLLLPQSKLVSELVNSDNKQDDNGADGENYHDDK